MNIDTIPHFEIGDTGDILIHLRAINSQYPST